MMELVDINGSNPLAYAFEFDSRYPYCSKINILRVWRNRQHAWVLKTQGEIRVGSSPTTRTLS